MSDTQQSRATLFAQLQATVNFSLANCHQTNVASTDTDDDIIISSALLIVSTLCERRQVNVRKCKRGSLHVNKQLTNHSSATEREISEE